MPSKRICRIDGCSNTVHSHSLCSTHRKRERRNGDPLKLSYSGTPHGDPSRFINEAILTDTDACIEWPFCRNRYGYARARNPGGSYLVPRIVCERVYGPPPSRKHEAAHSCGRGQFGCINAKHLRWATPIENAADKVAHGTAPRGRRNAHAKLRVEDVLLIRQTWRPTQTRAFAERFGVSMSVVNNVLTRKSWAWVT